MAGARRIDLPIAWKPFALPADGVTAVEHPAVDVRAPETLIGVGIAALSRGLSVGVFVSDLGRARAILTETLTRLGLRIRWSPATGAVVVTMGRYTLFVAGPKALGAEMRLPRCDLLLACDCDELQRNPLLAVGTPSPRALLFTGVLADRGHWWYGFARAPGTRRSQIDLETATKHWPEEAKRIPAKGDPELVRRYLLRDEVAPPLPLLAFMRRRLHVRTAKGREFLSPTQLAEVEREHGVGWDPRGSESAPPIVRFEATRMQRKYLALKELGRRKGHRSFLLLKYRRGGFTTLEQAVQYRRAVTSAGSQTATLSYDLEATRRVFRMTSTFIDHDPTAPRVESLSEERVVLRSGSTMTIGTAGGRGFGRGDAFQIVHGSEVSKWCLGPRQHQRVADLMAGIELAAQNGEVTLETTANGVDWFAQTYRDAKKRMNNWWPIFLPWFADAGNTFLPGQFDPQEIRDTLSEEEKSLIAREGLTHGQIAWRRHEKRRLGRLFPQEWPEDDETCFLSSGSCYFDVEKVTQLLKQTKEEPRRHVPAGHEIRWQEPIPGHEYVIGVDTSEGLAGGDPNGCGVLDRRTMQQVCSVHGLFRPALLAEHAFRLHRLYNRALVGVERENHGHAVIMRLGELGLSKSHLKGGSMFFHVSASKSEDSARAGWSTNEITRPLMLEALELAIGKGTIHVRDRDMLAECLSFRLQHNGRFEADPGQHDDSVMKWAIALQLAQHRKRRPRIILVGGDKADE